MFDFREKLSSSSPHSRWQVHRRGERASLHRVPTPGGGFIAEGREFPSIEPSPHGRFIAEGREFPFIESPLPTAGSSPRGEGRVRGDSRDDVIESEARTMSSIERVSGDNNAGRMTVGVSVLSLMRQLAEHEGHGQFFELTSEALHQACFAPPRRIELVVAETEGEIVGYATSLLQFSPWMGRDYLFLDDLYVRDEVRGLGIGSRLMRHVGALALEHGVSVRWHVEIENRSAQRLYRALGAELREKLIAYWSTESILAQINIADSPAI